jgi:spore photoproduct lyase
MNYRFSKIYIDEQVFNDEITRNVLRYYPSVAQKIISGKEDLPNLTITEGKRTLWLTRFKGNFLKPCPGTAEQYRCCNYLVINETTNCPIDCTYCILQNYINNPALTVYTNYAKILEEIQVLSSANPERILRIGTGELTDSLALDPATGLSKKLISGLAEISNVILELKTKTDHIKHLTRMPPQRTVLSWSVNPEAIVQSDEYKSATILQRLKAAKKAAKNGFLLGLHFDPIIYFPEWRTDYQNLIEQIADHLPSERLTWISLGSLRYPTQLKYIIQKRFPKTKILLGEQISGMDGKQRYLKPIRLKIYQHIVSEIRKRMGNVFIYFCMESEDIWQKVLGKNPLDNLQVDWYFAENLYGNFPELGLPQPRKEVYEKPVFFPDSHREIHQFKDAMRRDFYSNPDKTS